MISRAVLAIVVILASQKSWAQPDPHSIAPPEILQMDSLPNAGELVIKFCSPGAQGWIGRLISGWPICVESSTSCHGQCCNQSEADDISYGCSGDIYGYVPSEYRYVGWRCNLYSTPTSDFPVSGVAGPEPKYIKQCANRR